MPDAGMLGRLAVRYRSLDAARRGVESGYLRGDLSRRSAEYVYEGLFLNAYTLFERFLEEHFVRVLVEASRLGRVGTARPRVVVRSFRVARELMAGRREYADWMPYDHTEQRAGLMLRGGRPYTQLPAVDKTLLFQCAIIRHAIAHKSLYSLDRFEKHVIAGTPLPPRERQPGPFLRSPFRMHPLQTRYEVFAARFLGVARALMR